ncbi:MAG: hypothetical protein JST22_07000 [Bacteroidetes bacterium]|nr:hypothetical protein [Bacteroidota bacterium]
MNRIGLDEAAKILKAHPWIREAIHAAAGGYLERHNGQALVYSPSVRASMFRDHVVAELRAQWRLHDGVSVDDRPESGIFSLILQEEERRMACIFKKMRGPRPAIGQTQRQQAIFSGVLPMETDGTLFVPTWVFVGWKWDKLEQSIEFTRAACWHGGAIPSWYIPDLSTMIGHENQELELPEPATTEEFDSARFDKIMRPRHKSNVIQLPDGTQGKS